MKAITIILTKVLPVGYVKRVTTQTNASCRRNKPEHGIVKILSEGTLKFIATMEHTLEIYSPSSITRSGVLTKTGPATARQGEAGFDYAMFIGILMFWAGPFLQHWLY